MIKSTNSVIKMTWCAHGGISEKNLVAYLHTINQGPVREVGKVAYLRQTQHLVWIEITWPHFISAFQKHYPQPLISAAQSIQQSSRFNRNCWASLHLGIRALECVNPGIQKFNSHQT